MIDRDRTALRLYLDQVVLLPTVGRERSLAETALELLTEVERLGDLLWIAETGVPE